MQLNRFVVFPLLHYKAILQEFQLSSHQPAEWLKLMILAAFLCFVFCQSCASIRRQYLSSLYKYILFNEINGRFSVSSTLDINVFLCFTSCQKVCIIQLKYFVNTFVVTEHNRVFFKRRKDRIKLEKCYSIMTKFCW